MKRIAIVAVKGGTGKTTIANEIAHSLDRTNVPYSYDDMDGQRGSAHTRQETEGALIMIGDTPAALESDDLVALARTADVIVIPTRSGIYEMYSWSEALQTIRRENPNVQIIIVHNAVNRYRLARDYREWLEKNAEGFPIYSIPQAEPLGQAQVRKESVIDYAPKSKAAASVRDLVNAVRRAIGLSEEV